MYCARRLGALGQALLTTVAEKVHLPSGQHPPVRSTGRAAPGVKVPDSAKIASQTTLPPEDTVGLGEALGDGLGVVPLPDDDGPG